MQEIPNLHEQVMVNALLSEMNGKTSSTLDTFSGWLLGGFGAATVLLISQYDSMLKHLGAEVIHKLLLLFFWSLIIGVIEKYLSVGITSHSQGSAVGREIGEKAASNNISLNFEIIFSEMANSILPPMRWLVTRNFSKVAKGDLISSTRNITRLLQLQGVLVIIQAAMIIIAIYKIARGFHA